MNGNSWPIHPLGELAETALGKMLDRGKFTGRTLVPYLRNVNVQWDRIDTSDILTMELSDKERIRFEVRRGDLLVCEGGEVGRAAIWHGGIEYISYQKALHRVRSRGRLDLRFLRYLLEHYRDTGLLASRSTGSTIAHLPQERLRSLPVPCPDLNTQHALIELLDDHLSRVASAINQLTAARQRLGILRRVQAEQLLRSASVPTESLSALTVTAGYGTSSKCVADGRGIPVVRIPNVVNGRIDLKDEKRMQDATADVSNLMLQEGDLLIVRTNGSRDLIGRTAVVQSGINAAFASYLIRFQLDTRRIRPAWAHLVLQAPSSRAVLEQMAASSAGQYNLSLTKLAGLQLPIPTLADQDQMIGDSLVAGDGIQRIADVAVTQLERSVLLRRTLLAAAFSGSLLEESHDLASSRELLYV